MTPTRLGTAIRLALTALLAGGCGPPLVVAGKRAAPIAPTRVAAQDATAAEDARLMPAEAYLRTYLQLSGGAAPLELQQRARGDGARLFDNWNDYAAALGLPDHRNDLPRAAETNALMIATFDRLAIALCVRAAEHDLRGNLPPGQRQLFAFAGVPAPADARAFLPAFEVLHRTFLSYPAALAPPGRTEAFFTLFRETRARHETGPKTRLSPIEAAWAAVCVGLARHPEFQIY